MSRPRSVLVVARDAGAASALGPVVGALTGVGELRPEVVAWGNAAAIFDEQGIAVQAFAEQPAPSEVDELLASLAAAAVLTGTSLRVELDGRFWDGARRAGIPSVALLDHWKNYPQRFSVDRPFDTLPTIVAVMDEAAARELAARGCPPERIRVTGHPRFDALSGIDVPELRALARTRLGVESSRPLVVFASEPRGAPWDDGADVTPQEALNAVVAEVAAVAPDAVVLVKLHPVERDGPQPPPRGVELRVLRDWSVAELAAAADVFVGMTSIVLLDAALLGTPTLSVRRPNVTSHFAQVHADTIASVTSPAELRAALERALASGRRPPRARPGAARRVCDLLAELVGRAGIMPL